MKNSFIINNVEIGINKQPFIIAEMSGNHNQSLDKALEIVEAAAKSGAHAIKLQTYTPETMTIKHNKGLFLIDDPKSLWHGNTLYDLYEKAHTPWEWHSRIFERAKKLGLIPFSSPFDATAVDFLEDLNVPLYKIASFENKDWPLLRKVASTGKPIIMSTGATNLSEICEAVNVLKENGCENLILLKCTSTYPASSKNSNLLTIPHMSDIFKCPIGLSDHTKGIGVSIASISLGACVIEKHFTLSREEGGVDSAFSIEPDELKSLVVESQRAFNSLGKISYEILKEEKSSLRFKRSIYSVKNIKAGQILNKNNIRIIRPGDGLEPKYYDLILGKKVNKDVKIGDPISWEVF